MNERKDSGIPWIGDIPIDWELTRLKDNYRSLKQIVGKQSQNYERLALTLNGVIKRAKDDSEGLQPEAFDGYQIIEENDFIFKMIDLQNVSTSRVGLSSFTGIVSPAYIRFSPKDRETDSRFTYYFLMSLYFNCVFNNLGGNGVRSALNSSDMGNLIIPVPSEEKKKKIADALDELSYKINHLIQNQEQQIEQLKQYKQSLITEVVTKGLDPNAEMKDSGVDWIGKIPVKWNKTKVRYLGSLQNGISKGGEFFGEGYPFVSYGDVYKNIELPQAVDGLIKSNEEERNLYSVKEGDIFFTRTSETIEEVGFSAVCTKTIDNATFAGFLIRFRPFSGKKELLTSFAKYYFRSSHIRAYLVKEMNLVTRASLGQPLLKALTVLIPPQEDQIRIVKFLDDKCQKIDRLIKIKQKKIEKFNEYKKSLIYEYVTGKKEVI